MKPKETFEDQGCFKTRCHISPIMPETKPETPPLEVTVSFFVNCLKVVDAIAGTVELDFQLYSSWIDPKLVGIPVEDRPPYDEETRKADDVRECCWNPKIEVNNNVSLETLWSMYPAQHQGVSDGRVIHGIRYRGAISNDMDLKMFPLDRLVLSAPVGRTRRHQGYRNLG